MEYMGYMGNYRHLGQAVAEIQAGLPVQVRARCGAAGRAGRHWPSASPFRLRPNYTVPSGLSGNPASACRATARKVTALLAALLFAASGAVQAKSITALTPSFFDVNNAIGSAVDGDIVIIPAGTASWTSSLAITKAITLKGQTTIAANGTATDKTIIQFSTTSPTLVGLNTSLGKTYRISGITFQKTATSNNSAMFVSGTSDKVRIDNCHFTPMTNFGTGLIAITGGVYGVADHNLIEPTGVQVFHMLNGDTSGNQTMMGCPPWALDAGYGGPGFFFIEDNWISIPSSYTGTVNAATDTDVGCKFVFRHNHLQDIWLATHGTEGNARTGRAIEIYNNVWSNTKAIRVGGFRDGSGLFYNNTWDTTFPNPSQMGLDTQRSKFNRGPTFSGAGGANPWDINDTEGNGTYVEGHAPYQHWPTTAGTWEVCINDTAAEKSITVAGAPWTGKNWAGYTANRSDGSISYITASTSNTLTLQGTTAYTGHPVMWANGNQFRIYKLLTALDQCGRGRGDPVLRNGNYPNTTEPYLYNSVPTGNTTPSWPHQVMEPLYSWNNVGPKGATGPHIGFGQGDSFTILPNRDYYNDKGGEQTSTTSPFNGSQGVGYGTLSNRPFNGMHGADVAHVSTNGGTGSDNDVPGTAYWATDVPSINGSTDKGALYVWRGSAWVLYYQPYTYPHPLARDLGPPSNLQIVP